MDKLKSVLNENQYKAVTKLNGPLLVFAGAGSGKTRVITFRTAYMLHKGIPAGNILCVTFTNKAAKEMKDRIRPLIGASRMKQLTVLTFHALCARILAFEAHRIGYKRKYSIYTDSEQRDIIRNIIKEERLDPSVIDERGLLYRIGRLKNNLTYPEDLPSYEAGSYDELVKKIYFHYRDYLKNYNAFDFDDLLFYTAHIFANFPDVLRKYQDKYRYIMIDEYQDTNNAQYKIARFLSERHQNICVVGDDDQSIYAFRGADIQNILDFEKDFPDAEVIKLEENYRSTTTILEAANAVIRNNAKRKHKKLWTQKGKGNKVLTIEAEHTDDEAEKVFDDIYIKRIQGGYKYSDIAVLFRVNAQSRSFEEIFRKHKIPYYLVGAIDFYDRKEIKDLLAYLRVLNNPHDDMSLLRIINYPKRGIGSESLKRINAYMGKHNLSLYETLEHCASIEGLTPDVLKEIRHFMHMVESYGKDMHGNGMLGLLLEFVDIIGIKDDIYRNNPEPAKADIKVQNIDELMNSVHYYIKKTRSPALHDFLQKLAIMLNSDDEDEKERNAVNLMTIHAAKGLEFKVVYIIGFEEGLYPHMKSESEEGIEEERRLCYVAFTRAEEELVLSLCSERMSRGTLIPREPSRFLSEIPDELITRNYGRHLFNDKDDVKDDSVSIAKKSLGLMLDKLNE
ncbi:ATP-dependent helicase [Spirochaetota bacterium]